MRRIFSALVFGTAVAMLASPTVAATCGATLAPGNSCSLSFAKPSGVETLDISGSGDLFIFELNLFDKLLVTIPDQPNLTVYPLIGGELISPGGTYDLTITLEGVVSQLANFNTIGIFDFVSSSKFTDLNAVTLSDPPNPTPLPSTWLMLLSGFFGLGFFAYRGTKKQRNAAMAPA